MNEPDFKVRLLSEYSKEDLEVLYGAIRTTVEVTKLMPDDPLTKEIISRLDIWSYRIRDAKKIAEERN